MGNMEMVNLLFGFVIISGILTLGIGAMMGWGSHGATADTDYIDYSPLTAGLNLSESNSTLIGIMYAEGSNSTVDIITNETSELKQGDPNQTGLASALGIFGVAWKALLWFFEIPHIFGQIMTIMTSNTAGFIPPIVLVMLTASVGLIVVIGILYYLMKVK